MRNNPRFYLMTPAISGASIDVIAVHSERNLNFLYQFKRTHSWISLLSCTMDEAYMALDSRNGVGIGCYIPCADYMENRYRKVCSKLKLSTLAAHCKGMEVLPSIAMRLDPPEERRRKQLLKLFNS